MTSAIVRTCVALLLCVLLSSPAVARPLSDKQEQKFDMGIFYLCLLVKGPKWTPDNNAEVRALNQAHIKHIESLLASGKGVIAGPFGDDGRLRGVLVLNASSIEEARAFEEADPAVKAGRVSVEVLRWWAAKGIMKPPAQPLKMTTYYFAFLRRGPKWTSEQTTESTKLQEGHMANINAMAKAGKLVIAGPFAGAGELSGVFVFKVDSMEEAKALSESDPAVKAGRFSVEVHQWLVPAGSLP